MKKTKLLALSTAALLVALNAPAFADGSKTAKTPAPVKTSAPGGSTKVTPAPTASSGTTVKHTHTVHSMHKTHPKTAATSKPKSSGTKVKTTTDSKKTGTKS